MEKGKNKRGRGRSRGKGRSTRGKGRNVKGNPQPSTVTTSLIESSSSAFPSPPSVPPLVSEDNTLITQDQPQSDNEGIHDSVECNRGVDMQGISVDQNERVVSTCFIASPSASATADKQIAGTTNLAGGDTLNELDSEYLSFLERLALCEVCGEYTSDIEGHRASAGHYNSSQPECTSELTNHINIFHGGQPQQSPQPPPSLQQAMEQQMMPPPQLQYVPSHWHPVYRPLPLYPANISSMPSNMHYPQQPQQHQYFIAPIYNQHQNEDTNFSNPTEQPQQHQYFIAPIYNQHQNEDTNFSNPTAPLTPPRPYDAMAVASTLVNRGVTFQCAGGYTIPYSPERQARPEPAPLSETPSILRLNPAISIVARPARTSSRKQGTFAVPHPHRRQHQVERPPRPATVDLTQDEPPLPPVMSSVPRERGRGSNVKLLNQNMKRHRKRGTLSFSMPPNTHYPEQPQQHFIAPIYNQHQNEDTNFSNPTAPLTPPRPYDAMAVASTLANRGVTIQRAGGYTIPYSPKRQARPEPAPPSETPSILMLNPAISIVARPATTSSRKQGTFAVPHPHTRQNQVERPPRSETVDLTQDEPPLSPVMSSVARKRGRGSNVKLLNQHMTQNRGTLSAPSEPLPVKNLQASVDEKTGFIKLDWQPDNSSLQEGYKVVLVNKSMSRILRRKVENMEKGDNTENIQEEEDEIDGGVEDKSSGEEFNPDLPAPMKRKNKRGRGRSRGKGGSTRGKGRIEKENPQLSTVTTPLTESSSSAFPSASSAPPLVSEDSNTQVSQDQPQSANEGIHDSVKSSRGVDMQGISLDQNEGAMSAVNESVSDTGTLEERDPLVLPEQPLDKGCQENNNAMQCNESNSSNTCFTASPTDPATVDKQTASTTNLSGGNTLNELDSEYLSFLKRLALCEVCGEHTSDIEGHRASAGHYKCIQPECATQVFATLSELTSHQNIFHGGQPQQSPQQPPSLQQAIEQQMMPPPQLQYVPSHWHPVHRPLPLYPANISSMPPNMHYPQQPQQHQLLITPMYNQHQNEETNFSNPTAPLTPPRQYDEMAVASTLANRGVTFQRAGGYTIQSDSPQRQARPEPASPSESLSILKLNPAISIVSRPARTSSRKQGTFAVPHPHRRQYQVERPPRPSTVDLTRDEPPLSTVMRSVPRGRGRGSNVMRRFTCSACNKAFSHLKLLNQHMTLHQNRRTLSTLSFRCSMCMSDYPTEQEFRRHMRISHKKPAIAENTEVGFPLVDLKAPGMISKLANLGIQHYIPLFGQNGNYFQVPVVTPGMVHNLAALKSPTKLSLGPLKKLNE